MIDSERDYFSKGLAVPQYDIRKFIYNVRFRDKTVDVPDNLISILMMPSGPHGFRVIPIERLEKIMSEHNLTWQ